MTSGRSMSLGSVGESCAAFSYTERGRSKHKYHRRSFVWDLISGLVRQGHTADSVIGRIYAVYDGQTSVSNIISGLKQD